MNIFSVFLKIMPLKKDKVATFKAVVSTGAFVSVVPKELLKKLGIKPLWRRKFTLANGEKIEREVGIACFKWNGYEGASEVIFGEKQDKHLLGALTLESLGLKANPRQKKIEPIELLLL